jgi:hypothetical protein
MYRDADEPPAAPGDSRPFDRPNAYERRERLRIPQNEGRALIVEALSLLAIAAVLAVTIGVAVGIPLAMMLRDICSKLSC